MYKTKEFRIAGKLKKKEQRTSIRQPMKKFLIWDNEIKK